MFMTALHKGKSNPGHDLGSVITISILSNFYDLVVIIFIVIKISQVDSFALRKASWEICVNNQQIKIEKSSLHMNYKIYLNFLCKICWPGFHFKYMCQVDSLALRKAAWDICISNNQQSVWISIECKLNDTQYTFEFSLQNLLTWFLFHRYVPSIQSCAEKNCLRHVLTTNTLKFLLRCASEQMIFY